MRSRTIGVVTALAAITLVFAAIVLAIAAIEDYQENRGQSFIERAASIIGVGTLTEHEQFAQVKIEVTDDENVAESGGWSSEPPEPFRFFRRSDNNEEWLDDLFDKKRFDREDLFDFKDRVERVPDFPRFEQFEEFPYGKFELEIPWQSDWVDNLIEKGWMTEEDADEFRSWFDDLPNEFDDRLPDFSGDRDFEFNSDDGRFRFRWRWDSSDDEYRPKFGKSIKNGV